MTAASRPHSPTWLTARPVAHRGLHDAAAGRIENTLAAVEAAIERGYAIECDIQITRDGEPIVFHDDTLDRLTDAEGPVAKRTLAELRTARVRGSDASIPTLAELLALVAGRVPLFIELKSSFTGDVTPARIVASSLADYRGPAAVMSFDSHQLTAMRRRAPAVPRGMLSCRFDASQWPCLSPLRRRMSRWLLAAAAIRPSFVAYDVRALPASAPLLLRHAWGLPLLAWTVRTPADRTIAASWADQIIFEGFDPDAPSD